MSEPESDEDDAGGRTVTLVRLTDAVEAEMLRDFLRDAGLWAATPGLVHRGMLGMIGGYIDIAIQVRESELEEARELLEAFRGGSVVPEDDDDDDDDDDDEDEDEDDDDDEDDDRAPRSRRDARDADDRPTRLKRVAAFCALGLTFGCGHFYARSYRTASLLALTEVTCFALAMTQRMTLAFIALPVLVAADLFGSFVAVDRFNGKERSDLWARFVGVLPALALLAVVAVPALFYGSPRTLIGADGRAICDEADRCRPGTGERCVGWFARRKVEGYDDADAAERCVACIEADASCQADCSHSCTGVPYPKAWREPAAEGYPY